ncbi:hypothetical protein TNCT_599521 [Trichonephila clavata]|uniref:Uncharacterized protein n=1 Tax=Trichonephila clavata TaxID=2740835 RepID=A0A8X6KDU5_TRICU|nr:hypothetical protein TNCT_599521 [Trichonephila clavata]
MTDITSMTLIRHISDTLSDILDPQIFRGLETITTEDMVSNMFSFFLGLQCQEIYLFDQTYLGYADRGRMVEIM